MAGEAMGDADRPGASWLLRGRGAYRRERRLRRRWALAHGAARKDESIMSHIVF